MSALHELNSQICRSLGIDPSMCERVVLVLDKHDLPKVRITRKLRAITGPKITQTFDLVPHDRDADASPA